MSLEVSVLGYDNLTEEEREEHWIEQYDGRSLLRVTHNGEVIRAQTDGGEPEDNRFYRDWSWVADAIEEAYQRGLEDGLGK